MLGVCNGFFFFWSQICKIPEISVKAVYGLWKQYPDVRFRWYLYNSITIMFCPSARINAKKWRLYFSLRESWRNNKGESFCLITQWEQKIFISLTGIHNEYQGGTLVHIETIHTCSCRPTDVKCKKKIFVIQ